MSDNSHSPRSDPNFSEGTYHYASDDEAAPPSSAEPPRCADCARDPYGILLPARGRVPEDLLCPLCKLLGDIRASFQARDLTPNDRRNVLICLEGCKEFLQGKPFPDVNRDRTVG